jgi:hypothetical protein
MGLTMIHELLKLKIGNWTRALTITNVILGFVSIVYIIALITTQQVFNPAFLAGAGSRFTATWSTWTVNITAAVIISIYVWDMVESVRLAKVFEKQNK